MTHPCPTCGEPTAEDPDFDCDRCDSWDLTRIRFQKPEWPPIPIKMKSGNIERSEPLPEDQHAIKGGRFTSRKPGKKAGKKDEENAVQDGLFSD